MRTIVICLSSALCLSCIVGDAQATTNYVTPTGAGLADGSDWDNAYSNVQDAVNAAPAAGDVICLKYGVYSNASEIVVSNHLGLTIRGGYFGVGSPGIFTNDASVLTRMLSVTNRILYGNTATVTLDRVTITNGLLIDVTNHVYGAGLYLKNCDILMTNCVIEANRLPVPYRNPAVTKSHYGSGIYANGGALTIVDSLLRDNGHSIYGFSYCGSRFGDGVCAVNVTVTLSGVMFEKNLSGSRDGDYGCAVYLSGGSASISDCQFNTNSIRACWTGNGGAIYATGVSPLTIANCTFRGNYVSGNDVYGAYGGALYISSSTPLGITDCVFDRNFLSGNTGVGYINNRGGRAMYLTGTLVAMISDCAIAGSPYGNGPANDLDVNVASPNRVAIRNAVMRGALGDAIRKRGTGSLSLTNCLIYAFTGDGIKAEAGSVAMANCTVADNAGWGMTNAVATATVIDSVVWGNMAGGLNTNAGDTVTYTCSQEPHTGVGNRNEDPLLVGRCHLSVNGLPTQDADSPCIDAGSDTAASLGLDQRTTRTDASNDTDVVDLGYHATDGFSFANLVMYVNANPPGNDANDGSSPATAFKTITKALSVSIYGSTINVATGLYDLALGENFPLVPQEVRLTLMGTNRAATVIDAGSAGRVFSADGGGEIWLEGLTFTNGSAQTGAGIYLPACRTTITNCTIVGNRLPGPNATYKGGGIYAVGGFLTVVDSLVRNNGYSVGYVAGPRYGGGICAEAANVTLTDVILDLNFVGSTGPAGGGIYLAGGSALISGCWFYTNYVNVGWAPCGGAIYATGVSPLTITNCSFVGNSISGGQVYYGKGVALYIAGGSPFAISGCRFERTSLSGNGSYARNGSAVYLSGAAGSISDCTIEGHTSGDGLETIYVDSTSPGIVTIRNTVMKGVVGDGVYKKGTGYLGLTTCLIYAFAGDGVQADAGTVTLMNSTLADNGGWGVNNVSGVVTARNCIAWGNANGGFTVNCDLSYTCSDEAHDGDGNKSVDPLFEGASTNNYHLTQNSPCVNAGTEEAWMLTDFDLDGNERIMGGAVDMGAYETLPPKGTVFMFR